MKGRVLLSSLWNRVITLSPLKCYMEPRVKSARVARPSELSQCVNVKRVLRNDSLR